MTDTGTSSLFSHGGGGLLLAVLILGVGGCPPRPGGPCGDVECEEGWVCLSDLGECVPTSCDLISCDDGLFCNGEERCVFVFDLAECQSSGIVDCPPGWMCDEDRDECRDPCADVTCADGEECLDGECVEDPCSEVECDDGVFCNGRETCVGGGCRSGTPPCGGGTTCDEATDSCPSSPSAGVGGAIVAWGRNVSGQTDVPSPNAGFVAIAAGWVHSVGLKADGSIVAWGGNDWGQSNLPSPNAGFVAVAAGHAFSVGLKEDGSIVAWGSSSGGKLDPPSPNTDFVAVSAGSHVLGLKANGSIVAWGCDDPEWDVGQCDVPAPNVDFVAVAAGGGYSLGLKNDGSIVVWGDDYWEVANVPSPNTGFQKVAAAEYGMPIGLRNDGSIVAWGTAGDCCGHTDAPSPNAGFVAIAAGQLLDIALKEDGSIVTWGWENDDGQLDVPSPNTGFVAISAGGFHGLALQGELTVGCDGDCDDGDACNGIETCDADTGGCVDGHAILCDDGQFCNGAEICVDGACTDGEEPCLVDDLCNEDEDRCEECGNEGQDACPEGQECVDGKCIISHGNCERSIQIDPDASVQVYSVTDPVSAGWTVVGSSVSDGGAFSSSEREVRWLFFDGQPRTLTYELTPPASASGQTCFEATANYNGDTLVTLSSQCVTPPCEQ